MMRGLGRTAVTSSSNLLLLVEFVERSSCGMHLQMTKYYFKLSTGVDRCVVIPVIKAPVEELSQLREQPALVSLTDQEIPVGGHLWLGDQLLPEKRGNQSEILVSFKRPEAAVVLGVDVVRFRF